MDAEELARYLVKSVGYAWKQGESGGSECIDPQYRPLIIQLILKAQMDTLRVLKEFKEVGEDENNEDREEITGLSTKGTNENFCNSGFGGGEIVQLAAAIK